MKKLLIFFGLCSILLSLSVDDIYYLDKEVVHSTDVFDLKEKFVLFSYGGSFLHQIPKKKLVLLFKEHNVTANFSSQIVYFYKISPKFVDSLKRKIVDLFLQRGVFVYKILLRPSGFVELPKNQDTIFEIQKNFLNKTNGIITIFYLENSKRSSIKFNYEIEGYQNVPVANLDIKVGRKIEPEKFHYEKKRIKHNIFFDPLDKNISNYEAKTLIKKGSIIQSRSLKKSFTIKRGQKVQAFISEDGIDINFALKAKENGYIGDEIKLENDQKKLFYGIIIDNNSVKIH